MAITNRKTFDLVLLFLQQRYCQGILYLDSIRRIHDILLSLTRPRSATVLVAEAVARLKAKDHAGTNASDYLICLLFRALTCFNIPDALDYSQITSTLRYLTVDFMNFHDVCSGFRSPIWCYHSCHVQARARLSEMAFEPRRTKLATQHLGDSRCVDRSVL